MHKHNTPKGNGWAESLSKSKETNILASKESFEMSVVRLVGKHTKIPTRMMFHPSRCRADIAGARQLAMYLLNVSAGQNMVEIGDLFGRDRTTVSHACGRVEDRRDCPEFDAIVTRLEGAVDVLAANYNGTEANRVAQHASH